MKRAPLALAAVAVAATAAGCGGSSGSGTATLKWYTGTVVGGGNEKAVAYCNQQAKGRYRIEIASLPRSTTEGRELLVRRLAAKDPDVSLMGLDVIFTPEFAEAGWIKKFEGANAAQAKRGMLAGPLRSASWKGAVYAVPYNSNAQLLWYRKDLVPKPPTTWDELIAMAKKLPAKQGLIQEQGARYEGLVVWFNTLVNSAGGRVVDPRTGKPSLDKSAVEAARIIRDVARSGRADPSLSNNMEDQARLAFESGNSAFMLNWPYVYASAAADAKTSPVTKKVFQNLGWAPYPRVDRDKPSKVSIGGGNIAVGAFTNHPEEAFQAALCLANSHNQTVNAQIAGLPPTLNALYDDPAVRKSYPFAELLREQINNSVPRPETPAYADVALAIADTIHPPAAINPTKTIDTLRDRLDILIKGGIY